MKTKQAEYLRCANVTEVAKAAIDAMHVGTGWLKVDAYGNVTRIDPANVLVIISPNGEVSPCCGAEVVRDPGGTAFCKHCTSVLWGY